MKKYSMILTVLLLVSVLLTGCGCKHEWLAATCDAPQTCAKCGETQGEALEHMWVEATCAEAKHCQTCGATEGEPLPHTLTEANYQQAATCTICGAEVGEPLEAYFEKMGIEINVTDPGVPYDYKCEAPNNPAYTVNGILAISDMDTFSSADGYEAMEGYEWKRTEFYFIVPVSELMFDCEYRVMNTRYYEGPSEDKLNNLSSGENSYSTVNYLGTNYDECIIRYTALENTYAFDETFTNTRCWIGSFECAIRVPVGYDGIVVAAYNNTSEIKALNTTDQPIGEVVANAPDTLFYRFK